MSESSASGGGAPTLPEGGGTFEEFGDKSEGVTGAKAGEFGKLTGLNTSTDRLLGSLDGLALAGGGGLVSGTRERVTEGGTRMRTSYRQNEDGSFTLNVSISDLSLERLEIQLPATAEAVRIFSSHEDSARFTEGDTYVIDLASRSAEDGENSIDFELRVQGVSAFQPDEGEMVIASAESTSSVMGIGTFLP